MTSNFTAPPPAAAPNQPYARPGTSSSYYPSITSSNDGPDGFISEPERGGRPSGAYGRAGPFAAPPLPSGGYVPLAPAASSSTARHRRGSSTGDASGGSKFRRRLSATLGTLSSFGQARPHAHEHAEPVRIMPGVRADGAVSESEGATLRVGAQFVRAGSRKGRPIPPGLLEDQKEELAQESDEHAVPLFGRMLSNRHDREASRRPAMTAGVPRSSVDRADHLDMPFLSGPSSSASSMTSSVQHHGRPQTTSAPATTASSPAESTARPRPRDPQRDRQQGNKRLSLYLSQKMSEVGFGSHGSGLGSGFGLPPSLEKEEASMADKGNIAGARGGRSAGGKLQRDVHIPHRRQTDGGASALMTKPADERSLRPAFPRLPSNDSGLLLADPDPGVEVSELAKWGGPLQAPFVPTLPHATGTFGSASSLSSRHRYPQSAQERDAYFEPPTVAQCALLGTQDHSKQGVMALLGVGGDPMHAVGKKAPKRGLGDRVVSSPPSRLGHRPDPTVTAFPYAVGYEQETLDMEAMLLDSVASVRGHRYTSYPASKPPPKRVLDIGTGLGLWPIQQAKSWPDTEFVGLDIVPIQVDLDALARHQAARFAELAAEGETTDAADVDWAELARRIRWQLGDFLQGLPFDTGTFDMVRLSFCGLAIPEPSWPDVIEEAARVLKRHTGVLEVVDTTYIPPLSFPRSRRFSYDNLLRTSFIHPLPYTQIRAALAMSGLSNKQVLNHRIRRRAAVIPDADFVITSGVDVWIESALGRPAKRRATDAAERDRTLANLPVGLTSDDSGDEGDDPNGTAEKAAAQEASDDIILMAWICEKR